jgi:copper(I)-binding protein
MPSNQILTPMKDLKMMTHFKLTAAVSVAFLSVASTAIAQDITVSDAYLRVSGAMAKSAAAFMVIENTGPEDRLIDAKSGLAQKVELHTHQQEANGVMRMIHVEDGFAIPAQGTHALARGADHVMFLGLNSVPAEGEKITLTLTFEKAGDVVIEVPVDNVRPDAKVMDPGSMNHGTMNHGTMNHGTPTKGTSN